MASLPSPPLDPESPASSDSSHDETGTRLRRDAPEDDDDLDAQLQLAQLRRRFAGAEVEPVRFRHWEVERRLGRGGMGAVYLARDPELDRRVALKILAPPPGSDRSLMNQRLRREAQALARIQHPNVVQVHGVDLEAGRTVVEMEYVDGLTLRQWQQERRSWREVVAVYLQAGHGLVAIHAAGLVHRDIKPDNLLVGHDGVVKVVDLGLAVGPQAPPNASPTGPGRSSLLGLPLTRGSSILGTPGYMAPEQFGKGQVTAACDQFSFAAALYEALTGVLPFQGDDPADYAEALRRGVLRLPADPPRLPRWLTAALRKALSFEPSDRHRSCEALVDVLRRGLARRRNWLLGSSVLVGFLALPSAVWVWREPPADPCAPLEDELSAAQARADAERERRHARAAALRSPHVDNALRVFDETVDRHVAQWADSTLALCDAQARRAVAGELVDSSMARQRACLEHARGRLDDSIAVVADAGEDQLADRLIHAMTAVERLPICEDPDTFAHWPLDPPAELEASVSEALRLELAGDYPAAEARARAAVQASMGSHPLLHAEALYRLGHVLGLQERSKQAHATLEQARNAAFVTRNDGLYCEAVAYQAKLVAAIELDPAASERELELADACLELVGVSSPFVRAELMEARGLLALAAGAPDEAVRWHEQALAERAEHFGPDHYEVGKSLHNLANAHAARGEVERAHAELRRALGLRERLLGPWHPAVARVLFDLADLQIDTGELVGAKASLERVGAIFRRLHGPDAPVLAGVHLSLARAEVLRLSPDLSFAQAQLRRARELQAADPDLDPHHPDRAALLQAEGALVVVATRPETDWARALDAFSQATEILRRHDPRSPEVLTSVTKELQMLYGLRDHALLAAEVAAEGAPLLLHVERLEPSERGPLAWWIGDSSLEAGRQGQAVTYLRIALAAYRTLANQSAVDELEASLVRADRHVISMDSPITTSLTPKGTVP